MGTQLSLTLYSGEQLETSHLIPLTLYYTSYLRKPRWNSSCPHQWQSDQSYLLVEPDKYFPNEIENKFDLKSRNYFPGTADTTTENWMRRIGKLDGKFFIELAIFIGK